MLSVGDDCDEQPAVTDVDGCWRLAVAEICEQRRVLGDARDQRIDLVEREVVLGRA